MKKSHSAKDYPDLDTNANKFDSKWRQNPEYEREILSAEEFLTSL
jgi:hypothetical protein